MERSLESAEASTQEPLDEEQCWQAVSVRDRSADGAFVFAVQSTGIYCRPSCPARRPQRKQVTFFAQPHLAEAAGFRPCRRCHPQENTPPAPQRDLVEQIARYIETHLQTSLRLSDLSQRFHLSPSHLQRTFRRIMRMTPRQYRDYCRLRSFQERLHAGATVTNALYEAGYQSSSSVYERAHAQLGMTPAAYQHRGKGVRIDYAVVDTPLGPALIAATQRGIVTVRFGPSETALHAELAHDYAEAELARNAEGLRPWIALLRESLHGQSTQRTVPLDVQASAFQWKVWEALQAIPAGQTRSYRQIAHAIGQPTAARAVARACATNPVAVFVPCHRVIRENGQTGGYRWGREQKERLLALERRLPVPAGSPDVSLPPTRQ
jgi:AraC family transcriptional regulator of adaptative response/methylated-DNA-[protein]-cysteine methyltransferase